MPDLVIDDTGVAGIKLTGMDGTAVRLELDLWDVSNRLSAIYNAAKLAYPGDAPSFHVEFYSKVVEFLVGLGYPRVSHFVADKVFDAITEAANNLGKPPAVEPTPA